MVDRLFSDAQLAALYDPWCAHGQRDDFNFYMPFVMAAQAALDVGCGTGAMLHEARRAGHSGRLCGLDPAVGMLEQARRREDIEWILGDLASVAWRREFDLIVMTGHAFQVLVEDGEIRTSLGAIASALAENGLFAFETRNPLARAWERWTPEHAVEIVDASGMKVRIATEVEAPFDGRTVTFSHTFAGANWDQAQVSWSTLRFLDAESVSSFLSDAGLVIEQQYGDWDRRPLAAACPEIITIARLA